MKIREWLLGIFGLKNKEKPPEESVKEEVLILAYESEEFHLESEELTVKKSILQVAKETMQANKLELLTKFKA